LEFGHAHQACVGQGHRQVAVGALQFEQTVDFLFDANYHSTVTTISLKVPERLRQSLKAEAERRGLSQSALIRESLEGALRRERAKKHPSCLDLIRDLAGGFKGPPDLSTNPKPLEEAILSDHRRERKHPR
jgi:hypothetical protein